MTFDLSEWMLMGLVAAGLLFPFAMLYWLVYTASEDVPKDLEQADKPAESEHA